jgi:hypothetical protein
MALELLEQHVTIKLGAMLAPGIAALSPDFPDGLASS